MSGIRSRMKLTIQEDLGWKVSAGPQGSDVSLYIGVEGEDELPGSGRLSIGGRTEREMGGAGVELKIGGSAGDEDVKQKEPIKRLNAPFEGGDLGGRVGMPAQGGDLGRRVHALALDTCHILLSTRSGNASSGSYQAADYAAAPRRTYY